MKKLISIPTVIAVLGAASPAWACPTSLDGWSGALFVAIIAAFLAVPYAVMTSMIILSQATEWFGQRRWRGWFKASLGGSVVAWVGAGAGIALAGAADQLSATGALSATLLFTTPVVFEVAYMMWRHSRRPIQDSEIGI